MNRNYKTLERAELERLALFSGPTGRKAQVELARRQSVETLMAAGEVAAERRDATREEFDRSVQEMVAKAPAKAEPEGDKPKARTTRKK
jgi:hypothetical protein